MKKVLLALCLLAFPSKGWGAFRADYLTATSSATVKGEISVQSVKFPDGTIQVSSPPAVSGANVILNQGTIQLNGGTTTQLYIASGTFAGPVYVNTGGAGASANIYGTLTVDRPDLTGGTASRSSLTFNPNTGVPYLNLRSYNASSTGSGLSVTDQAGTLFAVLDINPNVSGTYSVSLSSASGADATGRYTISRNTGKHVLLDKDGVEMVSVNTATANFTSPILASSGTISRFTAATSTMAFLNTSTAIVRGQLNLGMETTLNGKLSLLMDPGSTEHGIVIKQGPAGAAAPFVVIDSAGTVMQSTDSDGRIYIPSGRQYYIRGVTSGGGLIWSDANFSITNSGSDVMQFTAFGGYFSFNSVSPSGTIAFNAGTKSIQAGLFDGTYADGPSVVTSFSGFNGTSAQAGGDAIFRGGNSQGNGLGSNNDGGNAILQTGRHANTSVYGTPGDIYFKGYAQAAIGVTPSTQTLAHIQGDNGSWTVYMGTVPVNSNINFVTYKSSTSVTVMEINRMGAIRPGSYTLAQIYASSASASGFALVCSDCTTDNWCVSTGTAVGAWARITSKTTVCQ